MSLLFAPFSPDWCELHTRAIRRTTRLLTLLIAIIVYTPECREVLVKSIPQQSSQLSLYTPVIEQTKAFEAGMAEIGMRWALLIAFCPVWWLHLSLLKLESSVFLSSECPLHS